ncbi:hypothetical protein Goari_009608 [Gossypium aridum]|uniref:Uncharacterized protein n=1 Tax=Gossypium aridum TaxID=34290 RepID=A0A7J8XXF8_GOSAI|nr:hypothetical protein [Gossypium aridum]
MGSRSHKELTGDGAKMISYHKNHSRVRLEGNILLKALLEVQQLSDMDFFTTLLHCQPKSLGIHKNINKQNNLLETIAVAVLAIATTTAVNSMKKTSQSKQIATSVNTLIDPGASYSVAAGMKWTK